MYMYESIKESAARTSSDAQAPLQRMRRDYRVVVDPVSLVQRKEGALLESHLDKGNNTGIPSAMKTQVENASGLSFDDVRVHYNSDKPAQLQALAYTQGSQVYIGPGQERHLGHELGHVVQQKRGRVRPTEYLSGIAVNRDPELEREAENGIPQMRMPGASSAHNVAQLADDPRAARVGIELEASNVPTGKVYAKRTLGKRYAVYQSGLWNIELDDTPGDTAESEKGDTVYPYTIEIVVRGVDGRGMFVRPELPDFLELLGKRMQQELKILRSGLENGEYKTQEGPSLYIDKGNDKVQFNFDPEKISWGMHVTTASDIMTAYKILLKEPDDDSEDDKLAFENFFSFTICQFLDSKRAKEDAANGGIITERDDNQATALNKQCILVMPRTNFGRMASHYLANQSEKARIDIAGRLKRRIEDEKILIYVNGKASSFIRKHTWIDNVIINFKDPVASGDEDSSIGFLSHMERYGDLIAPVFEFRRGLPLLPQDKKKKTEKEDYYKRYDEGRAKAKMSQVGMRIPVNSKPFQTPKSGEIRTEEIPHVLFDVGAHVCFMLGCSPLERPYFANEKD